MNISLDAIARPVRREEKSLQEKLVLIKKVLGGKQKFLLEGWLMLKTIAENLLNTQSQ